ncbi:DUF7511 domain-containing protein [Halobacterium litoreum]|uniref:DUF7511 domain-containing protein n=1 Tax=Halobacterium litoreum TaxID=2039234 RepID=A0ABD5NBG9_9EURY|nr:hypothetical protein [Halobacterium litoreum]UHH14491.1 hypothetical protein LT972_05700 [Halobacterium litoreum]
MSADSRRSSGDADDPADQPALSATVVPYTDAPDRCTVSPADADDRRRLTEWLSVDADAVVPLSDAR